MKKIFLILGLLTLCLCLVACDSGQTQKSESVNQENTATVSDPETTEEKVAVNLPAMNNIKITVNGQEFSATLYDNQTTQNFVKKLPLTIDMSELNGNEKFYYLEEPLPVAAEQIGEIRAGDLMLYGDDCLVLFYENFSSAYRYTRIGAIENAEGLAEAVGDGAVKIAFSLSGDQSAGE
nr:cyclophilin-like fold protein [uncultured Acetobacterium sp.]